MISRRTNYRRKARRSLRRSRRLRKRPMRTYRRVPLGVPKYRFAKLSYCDLNTTSVGVGSYQTFAYQTSLFDPYVALGGHQPMFFDQYAAMYQRYTVLGVAYEVQACTDAATNGPLILTVTPSGYSASPTSISIARERAGTKESIVSHGYKGRMKGYISASKILGVSRRQLLIDDEYSALVTANPSRMAYLTLQAWNSSGTGTIAVYMSIRLTFYCRFYDPLDPSQS